MSEKQYRFVVVEDPTTDRVLLVDTDYSDGRVLSEGKHRVIAVDAEPLDSLDPTIRASLRRIDEICDRLNEAYTPTCRKLSDDERLLAADEKLLEAQPESETG